MIASVGIANAQDKILVDPGENLITDAVAKANVNDTLVLARGSDYTVTEKVLVDKHLTIKSSAGTAEERPAVIFFTSTIGEGGGLFTCAANLTLKDVGG